MRRRILSVLLPVLAILLSACGTMLPGQIPPTLIAVETPGPLEKWVNYWDLGIRLPYPSDWAAPLFTGGTSTGGQTGSAQVILARSADAAIQNDLTKPVVSLGIVDVDGLGIPKDTSLQDIIVGLTKGPNVQIIEARAVFVAGQDASYLALRDSRKLVDGYALAFRMPDGRVGQFIAIGPDTVWAYDLPTFEAMRQNTQLLKPEDYERPVLGSERAQYPGAGISFVLPKGWITHDLSPVQIYHDATTPEYFDNSGFANGPQLMVRTETVSTGVVLQQAILQAIHVQSGDTMRQATVGGQPGIEIRSIDPLTGQYISFIGVLSLDKTVMLTFRWTAPGILADVTRPAFDDILASATFGPITAPVGTPRP